MKVVLVTLVLAISVGASAWDKRDLGSNCGLTDLFGDDSWKDIGRNVPLHKLTDAQISALPTLMKQQIILGARALIDEHVGAITNTKEAISLLKLASSGEEVHFGNVSVNGKEYTELLMYPGDNPVGVLFVRGTRHIVAKIQDSDVVCEK